MNRFDSEFSVIPVPARLLAGLAVVIIELVIWVSILSEPQISDWSFLGQFAFSIGIALVVSTYILLIGFVNGDARRRGMRYVMWTLLAIFIPNAIGIILYFVLRDPPMRDCPKCNTQAPGGFAFCPSCGAGLRQACPSCRRAVETGWHHCPRCGAQLGAAA